MRLPRLLIAALIAFVVLSVVTATQSPRPGTAERLPPGAGTPSGGVVRADLGDRRRVRAKVGDVVALTLSARDGRVAIPELGVDEGVQAGVPTTIRFVAVAAGRYAVRVGDPPTRRVATVVVGPAAGRPASPAPAPREPSRPERERPIGDEAITAAAPADRG